MVSWDYISQSIMWKTSEYDVTLWANIHHGECEAHSLFRCVLQTYRWLVVSDMITRSGSHIIFSKVRNFELWSMLHDRYRERGIVLEIWVQGALSSKSESNYIDGAVFLLLRTEEDSWLLFLCRLFELSLVGLITNRHYPPMPLRIPSGELRGGGVRGALVFGQRIFSIWVNIAI